jgi:hypothetical protein
VFYGWQGSLCWWLSTCTLKGRVICCWKRWSIDANYMHWNSTVVELRCVITDYMPGGSVHFEEWIVEVFTCAYGFIFFLNFQQCCIHIVSESFVRCIQVQNCYMLQNWSLYFYPVPLFLVTFQACALQLSYVTSPWFPLISIFSIYFLKLTFS